MSSPAMLYDLTKCVGCHFCEIACQMNKELPADTTLQTFHVVEQGSGASFKRAVRRHQCMHCLDPACASACPVGALHKTPEGPVVYDVERCIGCRYCMNACPFGVPKFDWDHGLAEGAAVHKCTMCADRQAEGLPPACVEACPTGAVTFGTRDEMLAEARARIAKFPDRYIDHIYGETEAGGTSVLILSHVDFEAVGLPRLGPDRIPTMTETVMRGTIPFAIGWAAVLTGVTAAVRWRERRIQENEEGRS